MQPFMFSLLNMVKLIILGNPVWGILKVRSLSESCESRTQKQKEQKDLEFATTAKFESRKCYNSTASEDMKQ